MRFLSSLYLFVSLHGSAYSFPQKSQAARKTVTPKKQELGFLEPDTITKHLATFCVAGSLFISSAFVQPIPANAIDTTVSGSLEKAIVDASDATYPVLKSLSTETVSPLANKVAALVTKKVPAEKVTTALDGAASALLNIPGDKLDTFTSIVKESYQGVSGESCSSIPLPVDAITTFVNSDAVTNLNSETVTKVTDKISALRDSVPTSTTSSGTTGLCLPNAKEGLERIWVGQTELFLSIPTPIKKDFAAKTATVAKSIPGSELLRILPDAKKILAGVDRKEAMKFTQTGKDLDKVIKQDFRFQALQTK